MSRATWRLARLLGVIVTLSGCIKPTTFNPYANPGRHELDRLQEIVNSRPDLETVEQQLSNLDTAIRATFAKYSPLTTFSSTAISHPTNGCTDPFHRTIGRQVNSDLSFGEPAPNSTAWLQIVTELAPVFAAAGFRPSNAAAPGDPPLPLGFANDSQIRADGALVTLANGDARSPLGYHDDTGCHLPAAWRTAPPPPGMRPANDPDVRYPYLYKSPGGRNVDAN